MVMFYSRVARKSSPPAQGEYLAAVAADVEKTLVTDEFALFADLAEVDATASHQFFLHLHEIYARYDGFMRVFALW